jgi:hypothetical protein
MQAHSPSWNRFAVPYRVSRLFYIESCPPVLIKVNNGPGLEDQGHNKHRTRVYQSFQLSIPGGKTAPAWSLFQVETTGPLLSGCLGRSPRPPLNTPLKTTHHHRQCQRDSPQGSRRCQMPPKSAPSSFKDREYNHRKTPYSQLDL